MKILETFFDGNTIRMVGSECAAKKAVVNAHAFLFQNGSCRIANSCSFMAVRGAAGY